jgi:hypothetical protein
MLRFSLGQFTCYALGGLGGFLGVSGYWYWHLWREFGNPLFPYWNETFRSPWAPLEGFQDLRFVPRTFQEGLTYPFRWFIRLYPSIEPPFRDARWAILTILVPLVIVATAANRIQRDESSTAKTAEQPVVASAHFWLLILFFISTYVLWIRLFGIQRYLIPLSLTCGLVIFLALDRLLASQSAKIACFTFLALFCMSWTRPAEAVRLPYGHDWFGVQLTDAVSAPDTLFIMMGDSPASYVVPFLPGTDRVIRTSGNFLLQPETGLGQVAMQIITQHHCCPVIDC